MMCRRFFFPAQKTDTTADDAYFGAFGGSFVPEALFATIDELADEYAAAKADPSFVVEFDRLMARYVGRPSPLTEVNRFAEQAGGARIFLKREDLNHTGSHKINNVLGQALLAKRIGKVRVIADTGAGQHGVATATACALLGLECTVYMGEVDTRRQALNVARMMIDGGCDIIEVGIPYSDPMLDGPVNQTAYDIALRGGVTMEAVLNTVSAVASRAAAPVLVMTYWNCLDRYGIEKFAADLAAAGGSGCILLDLPVQESASWRRAAERHRLATVFVVAPSTRDDRLGTITAAGSGFVYAASIMGVTGARDSVSADAEELVRRTRATTALPVCIGLGVTTGSQAAQVAGYADGVIVGSAFVRQLLDAPDFSAGLDHIRQLTAELARGVRTRHSDVDEAQS
jgi:tryptophan synthase alpha chain